MRKPLVIGLGTVLLLSAGLITAVVVKIRSSPSPFISPEALGLLPVPQRAPPSFGIPPSASPPAASDFPAAASPMPYKTEQEWIIASVCRNAFELLAFAKDKKGEAIAPDKVTLTPIPGDVLSYDVKVQGATTTAAAKLQWPGSIWAPAAYVPFCQAAAQALQLTPPAAEAKPQGNPLHTLLDFSESAIESENRRVSLWLASEPDNAAAHEQAALVLGTLAMKENSGWFWDPRDICNHVCTHLAVAKFLRGDAPLSIEGRLADIDVGLIVDTKTQTGKDLDALAAEKDAPADLAAWINGGRMRNTRDWRIVKTPESATPFEQVEYFRAFGEAMNITEAISWLEAHQLPDRSDWTRIILEMPFTVEAGHVYAEKGVAQEISTMQATFPGSFNGTSLIGDLNEPPGDAVNFNVGNAGVPTVISRGMWAQFFQRHLCHAIAALGDFYANKWGVPDNARELDLKVDDTFSKLSLYPYLRLVEEEQRHTSGQPAAELASFRAHPEWGIDDIARFRHVENPDRQQLQTLATAWFNPPVIHGTAYGAMSRRVEPQWDKAQTDQLYAIAPLQASIADQELHRTYGDKYTLAQAQQVFGPLLDYYAFAMREARDSVGITLDQQVALMQKAADVDPDNYYSIAKLYVDAHQDDKAAAAYQTWYDKEEDRVAVSNEMGWLVNYYYDHGQQDKALAIAKEGAEVYSYTGLEIMMKLQERMGNLDDAEDYGKKIQDRYNESGPLASFYRRHADKGADAKAKLDGLASSVFPGGMKKVTLASFAGAPVLGMTFGDTTDVMRGIGFTPGTVVVALDGYAVENEAQYMFIRSMSEAPDMRFIVWDGQAYKELKANLPGRRFGVPTADYHP